jgi:microcystin-dependent protein
VGTIAAYAGVTAPTGWLLCNGTSTTGYTSLAALVGATTPDMRGRFPIGDNASLSLLGTGGSLTITANNLPLHTHANSATFTGTSASHNHTQDAHNHTQDAHTHDMTAMGVNFDDNAGTNGFVLTGASFDGVGGSRGNQNTTATNQATTATNQAASITPSGTVTMTNGDNTSTLADYYQPYLVVNYIIKHD